MDETDRAVSFNENREGAVGADTAAAIAELDRQGGFVTEPLRPGAGAEQEIVARSFDLDQMRSHGLDPRAAMQVEASLSLPARSTAVTL